MIYAEEQIQIDVMRWARLQEGKWPELRLLYHCPNGGRRGKVEAARLKAAGVKAGVPDLCLPVPRGRYHGLYIELKAEGGRLSPSQREWLTWLDAEGYCALRCTGFDETVAAIKAYLTHGEARRDD